MAQRQFVFLNGNERGEKGVEKLDVEIFALRGNSLPMKLWGRMFACIKNEQEQRMIEAWLERMEETGFISCPNGKKSDATWQERLIVHAAKSAHKTPHEIFHRTIDQKSAIGIIISKNYWGAHAHHVAHVA